MNNIKNCNTLFFILTTCQISKILLIEQVSHLKNIQLIFQKNCNTKEMNKPDYPMSLLSNEEIAIHIALHNVSNYNVDAKKVIVLIVAHLILCLLSYMGSMIWNFLYF